MATVLLLSLLVGIKLQDGLLPLSLPKVQTKSRSMG